MLKLKKTKIIAYGLTFMTASALLAACSSDKGTMPLAQGINADFINVHPNDSHLQKRYPGTIEGTVNVDIKAQVSGYLETIFVKEGDYVTKGQSMFKIKSEVYGEQVNNSAATLKSALAAQSAAAIEVEKIKPLVEGKVVSDIQLKTAEANYQAAVAQVAQAKAALGSSKINADFAVIKAPVSGYIGRIPNRVGNLVTPADPTPLTTLSEINNVLVYFSMSEADFIEFTRDRKTDKGLNTVQMITADGAQYEHAGKLELASGNIDRTTGSIALKAVFANPDKLLRAGGSARIILDKKVNAALTIPMACVKDLQDKYFVFVLADSNKVAMKPIEIMGSTGENYIVKSGIANGDKVAINSIDVLADGVVVTPKMVSSNK